MEQRLARIEALLEHMTQRIEERHEANVAESERVQRTLYGDGNGTKGLLIKIDRLEQDANKRTLRERTMFGAIALLVIRGVWDLLVNS